MADKSLRSRLKRLFSTNVIVRHAGGRTLKVADTNKVQEDRELVYFLIMNQWTMIQSYHLHLIYMRMSLQ